MEIEGKIARIRNDKKSVSLGYDDWYNSFKPITEDFKIGDSVKIVYSEKKTEDKTFKNLKSIIKILDESKQCKPLVIFKREDSNNEKLMPKQLTNQSENTIILAVKDVLLKELDLKHEFTESEFETKAKELTKLFKELYYSL